MTQYEVPFLINDKPLCDGNGKLFVTVKEETPCKYPVRFDVNNNCFIVNGKPWVWCIDTAISYETLAVVIKDTVLVSEDDTTCLTLEFPDTKPPLTIVGDTFVSCRTGFTLPICVNGGTMQICSTTEPLTVINCPFLLSSFFKGVQPTNFLVNGKFSIVNPNCYFITVLTIKQLSSVNDINVENDLIPIIRGRFTFKCRVKYILQFLRAGGMVYNIRQTNKLYDKQSKSF